MQDRWWNYFSMAFHENTSTSRFLTYHKKLMCSKNRQTIKRKIIFSHSDTEQKHRVLWLQPRNTGLFQRKEGCQLRWETRADRYQLNKFMLKYGVTPILAESRKYLDMVRSLSIVNQDLSQYEAQYNKCSKSFSFTLSCIHFLSL